MRKAEECLKQEEDRVESYLHVDSKPKLLKQVESEVLANYNTHSGCRAPNPKP